MMTNLKLCFFFLLSPLFLLPSLFFLHSPSQSAFAKPQEVSQVVPSNSWTPEEKQQTLSVLSKKSSTVYGRWLVVVAFGLPELKFKSGEQDVVFYFDKLAAAFQTQIFEQKTWPTTSNDFDYTKIQGEAQEQLLQVYQKGTIDLVDGFELAYLSKWNKYGDLFLNSIRPSLLKMQVLGLSKVKVSYESQYNLRVLLNLKNLENISYKALQEQQVPWNDFELFVLLTFSPIPNHAKTVLDRAINKVWTLWLKVLQKARGLGLTHLTVDKARVDVSSLVNSSKKEASDFSLKELQILKKLQPLGFQKFQTQVQVWIDIKLDSFDSYKINIQSVLENFATSKIKKIKINGISYQVDLLLKKTNLQLSGSQLPEDAKNQLQFLMSGNITKVSLADALTTALKTREAEATILQTQKNQNQKKLIIGLSVTGGVLTLSVLGGFLYWFFRIKK